MSCSSSRSIVGLVWSVVALTATLLMGSPSPVGAVAGYGDVPEGTWYTDAVQWSVEQGITGIGGTCFVPDAPVSRGETAVWIYNMEGRPAAGVRHSFSDVTDASLHDAVSWMSNTRITTGTSATTFAPGETLTRGQAAAFLHRLAGEPAARPHRFVDVVAGWQQAPVSWMVSTGITTGTSATTFAPQVTLTRAHLVTFLYRYQGEPAVTVDPANPRCDPSQGGEEGPVSRVVRYQPGEVIAGFPSGFAAVSGNFSGASARISGGVATVEITRNGSAAYSDATYTCASSGGCTIVDGRVTKGTVTATRAAADETAPDLVVGSPTVDDSSPDAGESFRLSATVRNQGDGRSASTVLRYYRSTDATITTGDTAVGADSVPGLDARESETESVLLTAPAAPGTYYYGACVDSVAGESDATNNCSASVTITVGTALDPPSNQTYIYNNTNIVVTWDAVTGATHYNVYYDDDRADSCSLSFGTPSFCELLASNVTGTSYTHTSPDGDSVNPGDNYYWVTACNASGCSAVDSDNPATNTSNPPDPPSNQTYRYSGASTAVSWDASADATHYNVYYDDDRADSCSLSFGTPSFCELLASNVTGTSYTHTSPDGDSVNPGDNYYWVTACNASGCSAVDSKNPATNTSNPPSPIVSLQTTTANGRCAPAIVLGIYDWENCAWEVNPNPELSRSAMLSLTQKVWSEMEAPGKPDEPPSLTEGYCGVDTLGCYLPSTHTIQLSEGFTLRTLLHELAHALVSESDSARECDDDWTHRQPECSHGDLFRCAADLLYVRYGGLESSGVCGQSPNLVPGSWFLGEPFEVEWGIGHASAAVRSDDNDHWLQVRCESNFEFGTSREFSVLLIIPRTINDDTVRIHYRFSNERQLSDSQWSVADSGDAVFFRGDRGSFLDRFSGADKLHMRIEYGERDIERLTFDLGDSPGLSIVRSACR